MLSSCQPIVPLCQISQPSLQPNGFNWCLSLLTHVYVYVYIYMYIYVSHVNIRHHTHTHTHTITRTHTTYRIATSLHFNGMCFQCTHISYKYKNVCMYALRAITITTNTHLKSSVDRSGD